MKIGSIETSNPLEILECAIAFSSRDWSLDRRDRIIYAIVFGWEEETYRNEFGLDEDAIEEYKKLHNSFKDLKKLFQEVNKI